MRRSAGGRVSLPVLLLVFCFLGVSTGCVLVDPDPFPATAFLAHAGEIKELPSRAPWQGTWFSDQKRLLMLARTYGRIHIAPVNVSYAEQQLREAIRDEHIRRVRIEELRQVARFMREAFRIKIEDYAEGHILKVLDEKSSGAIVLELAIVEVKPTNFAANAAGTIAGFFLPGGGLIKLAAKGSVAMEGVLRDGATGEILMEFKDRRSDKNSPFSVKDFQEYAHIRASISEWAAEFAELLATPADHRVKSGLPFSVLPF